MSNIIWLRLQQCDTDSLSLQWPWIQFNVYIAYSSDFSEIKLKVVRPISDYHYQTHDYSMTFNREKLGPIPYIQFTFLNVSYTFNDETMLRYIIKVLSKNFDDLDSFLPDCCCRLLLGAAPKGSGKDPKLDFIVEGCCCCCCVFGVVFTFPKSAKFVFSVEVEFPPNCFALGWVENEFPPAFKLLFTFGGQFKFDVDCTGLLPVVGHGLVFNCAKLLDPSIKGRS